MKNTSSNLGIVLELVVGVHTAQEVLSAPGGGDVLNAHMEPLLEYPVAHLQKTHMLKSNFCRFVSTGHQASTPIRPSLAINDMRATKIDFG